MKRWYLLLSGLMIAAVYVSSWRESGRLGITKPMANLRYFHYGSAPGSVSDRMLYVFYYPVYRTHLVAEDIKNQGRAWVHWSDRRDTELPSDAERQ